MCAERSERPLWQIAACLKRIISHKFLPNPVTECQDAWIIFSRRRVDQEIREIDCLLNRTKRPNKISFGKVRRGLSLKMIRTLHKELKIPLEVLVGASD